MPKKREPLSDIPWDNQFDEETDEAKRKVNEIEEKISIIEEKVSKIEIGQHKNLSDKIKQWTRNALLVAVVGSTIVALGQLATTPSDFAISIGINAIVFNDSATMTISKIGMPNATSYYATTKIFVDDVHSTLSPYKFNVYLRALNVPKNVEVVISPKEIKAGGFSYLVISYYPNNSTGEKFDEYPIVIEGRGGDGKIRNSTFFLSTQRPQAERIIGHLWQ